MLREAVAARRNILVAGGASTGKTTLTNALLAEIAGTADRVVLIEDTCELQCRARNPVALRTKDGGASRPCLIWSARPCASTEFKLAKSAAAKPWSCSKPGARGIPAGPE